MKGININHILLASMPVIVILVFLYFAMSRSVETNRKRMVRELFSIGGGGGQDYLFVPYNQNQMMFYNSAAMLGNAALSSCGGVNANANTNTGAIPAAAVPVAAVPAAAVPAAAVPVAAVPVAAVPEAAVPAAAATTDDADTHGTHGTPGTDGIDHSDHVVVFDELSSLHQAPSDGLMLGPFLDPIFAKLGMPSVQAIIPKMDALNAFNTGQPDEKKAAGAYVTLITAAKFLLLPPKVFLKDCPVATTEDMQKNKECKVAAKCYGRLKYFATKGDTAKVKQILQECGGSQKNLTDSELVTLWGTNEHHNLHCCLVPGGVVGNAVHATSLNNRSHLFTDTCNDKTKCTHPEVTHADMVCDWPATRPDRAAGDGSLCKEGWLGGYNDTGRYPQWNWFIESLALNEKLGINVE
jgi:hypothetical protein